MTRLDELIIAQTEQALAAADHPTGIVFDDPDGALLRHLLPLSRQVIVGARTVTQAQAAEQIAAEMNARDRVVVAGIDGSLRLDELIVGADIGEGSAIVALTHLPKSLAELDYYAKSLAFGRAGKPVTLIAGGNNKHMTRNQNAVLAKSFQKVWASRGQGKFRCLLADSPVTVEAYQPVQGDLLAVGGVFSGATADYGGEFLAANAISDLNMLAEAGPLEGPIIDLGCGNGSVAFAVKKALPEARIIATDISADAIVSTRLNVPGIEVIWDESASTLPEGEASAVLLNPPFHAGTTVDPTLVQGLLAAAHRLLRPGGVLYLVHNSHLRYRDLVEDSFSNVTQMGRNQRFTVLRAEA